MVEWFEAQAGEEEVKTTPLACSSEPGRVSEKAATHPIKLGSTVHDRADVRMGAFERRDSAMLGNEVKKGPCEPERA